MPMFENPVVHWKTLGRDLAKLFFNSGYTTEGQGATLMLGLGLWLVLGGMFSTCPAVYYVMAAVAGEHVWGVVFLTIGSIQIYALLFGSVWLRRYVLLFKGGLWATLTVTLLYGDWHAPGVPIYSVLAITAFRAFLAYGRNGVMRTEH